MFYNICIIRSSFEGISPETKNFSETSLIRIKFLDKRIALTKINNSKSRAFVCFEEKNSSVKN